MNILSDSFFDPDYYDDTLNYTLRYGSSSSIPDFIEFSTEQKRIVINPEKEDLYGKCESESFSEVQKIVEKYDSTLWTWEDRCAYKL